MSGIRLYNSTTRFPIYYLTSNQSQHCYNLSIKWEVYYQAHYRFGDYYQNVPPGHRLYSSVIFKFWTMLSWCYDWQIRIWSFLSKVLGYIQVWKKNIFCFIRILKRLSKGYPKSCSKDCPKDCPKDWPKDWPKDCPKDTKYFFPKWFWKI